MIRTRAYIWVIFLLLFNEVKGQVASFPEQGIQFPMLYSLYNPGAAGIDNKTEVKILNSFYTGLAESIGTYSLEADLSLQKKHTPGLVVFAEQETEYLRRIRTFLRYAYHLPLSDKSSFSLGAALGFFNYFVKATPSSAGASVFAPDGMAGLWIRTEKYNFGVSVGQLFNSQLTPISRTVNLARYIVINTDRNFSFSPDVTMKLAIKAFYGNSSYQAIQAATLFEFYKNFVAGLYYSPSRSAGFSIGLSHINILNVKGDLSFGFLKPTADGNPFNSNRIEIVGRFYFNNEADKE